jgi:hypothetical protein
MSAERSLPGGCSCRCPFASDEPGKCGASALMHARSDFRKHARIVFAIASMDARSMRRTSSRRLSTTTCSTRFADADRVRKPASMPPEEAKPKKIFSAVHPPLGRPAALLEARVRMPTE